MKRNNKRSIKLENVKFKKIKRNILGVSLFIFCINNLASTSAFADSKVDTNIEQKEETIDNTISTNGDSDVNVNDEDIVNADTNNDENTNDENIINTDNDVNTDDGNNYNDEDRQVNGDKEVDIPDPNLRYALNSKLGRPADSKITQSQLNDLRETLDLSNKSISNIEGLEHCINVSHIKLDRNQISDIGPLEKLDNLITLSLANNEINDISPLKGLTNLTILSLNNNKITDIDSLSKLTDLGMLYLGNNKISNIDSLSALSNLSDLYLEKNQISDISKLSGLPYLTFLDLSDNKIIDINSLSKLTNLYYLYLNNNEISDISSLKGLTNLFELHLNNNEISDISHLNDIIKPGVKFDATNQRITLEESEVGSNEYSVENKIIGKNGAHEEVTNILPDGEYDPITKKVTWNNLKLGVNDLSYKWSNATDSFSGTVTVKVNRTADPNALIVIPKEIKMGDLKGDDINVGAEVTIKLTYDNSANLDGRYELYTEPVFYISEAENDQNKVGVGVYETKDSMLPSKETPLMILDASHRSQNFFIKAEKYKFEKYKKYSGSMTINIKYIK